MMISKKYSLEFEVYTVYLVFQFEDKFNLLYKNLILHNLVHQ